MKRTWVIDAVVVLAVFAVYLITLCPTVFVGDAGELAAASAVLGVAHPPGYPLFCVWEKLMITCIPFANVAWRANLGMAIASCLAAFMAMRLMKAVFPSATDWARAATAVSMSWSAAWWSQSVIAEVYALNTLIFLWWGTSIAKNTGHRRSFAAYGSAALVGLGIANHHTMLLVGAMWWLVTITLARKESRMSLGVGTALIVGVMAMWYLYVPLRSLTNPMVDWGNPETFQKVLNHFSRRQYAAVDRPARDSALLLQQGWSLLKLLLAQIPWWWTLLGVLGLGGLWKCGRRALAWGTAVSAVITLFIILVTNFTPTPRQLDLIKVFLIPIYGLWIMTVGGGLTMITARWNVGRLLWIVLPGSILASNLPANDLSRQDLAYRYAQNILRQVEPGSTLLVAGDNIAFPLGVLNGAEGLRPDVTVVDRFGNMFRYLYGEEWLDKHQRDQRRIEVERQLFDRRHGPVYYATMEVSPKLPFSLRVDGCIRRVEDPDSQGEGKRDTPWRRYDLKLPPPLPEPEVFIQHLRVQYAYYQSLYWIGRGEPARAWSLLDTVKQEAAVVDPLLINLGYAYNGWALPERAIKVFQEAVSINPWLVEGYIGWGATLGNLNRLDEAIVVFQTAIQRQPGSAEARNSLGIAFIKQHRLGPAIEIFEENIRLNPHYVDSYNELGLAYALESDQARTAGQTQIAAEKLTRALSLWEEVLSMAPSHHNARMNADRARRLLISP